MGNLALFNVTHAYMCNSRSNIIRIRINSVKTRGKNLKSGKAKIILSFFHIFPCVFPLRVNSIAAFEGTTTRYSAAETKNVVDKGTKKETERKGRKDARSHLAMRMQLALFRAMFMLGGAAGSPSWK